MNAFSEYPPSRMPVSSPGRELQQQQQRRRRKRSLPSRKTDAWYPRLFLLAAAACYWQALCSLLSESSLSCQVAAFHHAQPSRTVARYRTNSERIHKHSNAPRLQSTLRAIATTRLYSIQGQESIHVNAGFNQSPRQISIPSSSRPKNNNNSDRNGSPTANNNKNNTPAPVYITVGPPCAGKTTALAACLEQDGYDPATVLSSKEVALDEQSNVYVRVPLAAFLFPQTHLEDPAIATNGNTDSDNNNNNNNNGTSATTNSNSNNNTQQLLLGDSILVSTGTTLRDRLLDPPTTNLANTDTELRNVILRVAGRTTPQEFAQRIRTQALEVGDTVKFFQKRRIEVAEDLIDGVEQVAARAVGELLLQMLDEQQQQEKPSKVADLEHEQDLPYDHYDTTSSSGGTEDEDSTDDDEQEEPQVDLRTMNATSAHLLSAKALIKTPYVDLFVPQALFNGGIDKAERKLQKLLKGSSLSTPISWGNTNTRPVEYAAALAAAQRAGRPVKFVAWGTSNLPRVPRRELLRRTVSKFRNTGRYVPAGAVGAALGRVERLIQEAEKEARKLATVAKDNSRDDDDGTSGNNTEVAEQQEIHRMNVAFAALAGYLMYDDGHVMRISDPKNLNQKSNKASSSSKQRGRQR